MIQVNHVLCGVKVWQTGHTINVTDVDSTLSVTEVLGKGRKKYSNSASVSTGTINDKNV